MERLDAPKMDRLARDSYAASKARWIYSEKIMILVFKIIIVTFLFLCGCILRSLCCAIITDGCMLGPTKRNPNLIVFWKGSDHRNPKKMLHPLFFFSSF